MTVYLDVVFLENICMNYIIIYATILLLKLNKKPARIFLGSLIGAIYAVINVMKIFEAYNSIFLKILVSIIIMYVAVDVKNFKGLLKAVLMFYFVSFTFGGIALALLYFIKPENILMKNGVYIGTYPIKVVLLGGILGYILVSIIYSIIKGKYSKKKKMCDVEISLCGKAKYLQALIDTGNFLKEPITGAPVIVIETLSLYGLVPTKILENVDNIISGNMGVLNEDLSNNSNNINESNNCNNDTDINENINDKVNNNENVDMNSKEDDVSKFLSKFRIIPFNSLGKENGMLLGIKADYLKVVENKEFEHPKIENVIIALYNKRLSKERCIQCYYWCRFIRKNINKPIFIKRKS